MVGLAISASSGEAFTLGLATGPICVASCGPIVVPWLLAQPGGLRTTVRQISVFLAARLAGYLLFGFAVWVLGSEIPRSWSDVPWFFGVVQLLLAGALVVYAAGWPRRRCAPSGLPDHSRSGSLVQIGKPRTGAATLGLLTGLSLCPPFLVAGVRAAQLESLPMALLFFALFFAGTAVWFVPFAAVGAVGRTPQITLVARMAALIIAAYYGVVGIHALMMRMAHG